MVAGMQADHALLRLAQAPAHLRAFDAVVDGIAQQMRQGRFQALQHVAIDLGALAAHLQPHQLAQGAAKVTDHPRLPRQHVGE